MEIVISMVLSPFLIDNRLFESDSLLGFARLLYWESIAKLQTLWLIVVREPYLLMA